MLKVFEQDYEKKITFKGLDVIGFNCLEEFKKIPKERIFDFLPYISSKEDNMILKSWIHYFNSLKVPFVITKEENTYSDSNKKGPIRKRLWKERII